MRHKLGWYQVPVPICALLWIALGGILGNISFTLGCGWLIASICLLILRPKALHVPVMVHRPVRMLTFACKGEFKSTLYQDNKVVADLDNILVLRDLGIGDNVAAVMTVDLDTGKIYGWLAPNEERLAYIKERYSNGISPTK